MVHVKVNEESVRAVAKLYAELSTRVDPASVAVAVLVGEEPGKVVNWVGRGGGGPAFVGSHAGCSNIQRISGRMTAPLYLAPEEWFRSEMSGLSLKPYEARLDWTNRSAPPIETLTFGGSRADVSGVLDGLRVHKGSRR
jgi:hypothetical protein